MRYHQRNRCRAFFVSGTFSFVFPDPQLNCTNFIASLGIFEGELTNVPGFIMKGTLFTSGRVEITLFAGRSCVILVGELKFNFQGDGSNVIAQMLCEADGTLFSSLLPTTG